MRQPRNTFEMERMESNAKDRSKTLFSIKFGVLTAFIRDVSLIVLIWKIIGMLSVN